MSYYLVEPPGHVRVARRAVPVVVAVAVMTLTLTGRAASQPVTVMVDGARVEVVRGTNVDDLRRARFFQAPAGDLLGVHGGVAAKGAGEPPRVLRNGRSASGRQRVFGGDVLVSRPGADVVEPVEVIEVPIPHSTRVEGSGPIVTVLSEGRAGLRRVTRGRVSRTETRDIVVRPPRQEVVRRTSFRPEARLVALTFDDGPWPGSTEAILDVLSRSGARATFFVLGRQVDRYPWITRRIAAGGHLLGSHSYSHKRFSVVSPKRVRDEIVRGRGVIRSVTGVDSAWIRPPYGAMDGKAWSLARELEARVVLWDVDPKDWRRPGTKRIVDRVVRTVRPGSVVLLHDGGGDRSQTIEALPHIIEELRARGYSFVTIEELVASDKTGDGRTARTPFRSE